MLETLSLAQFIASPFSDSGHEFRSDVYDALDAVQLDRDMNRARFIGTKTELEQFKKNWQTKLNNGFNYHQIMTTHNYNNVIFSATIDQFTKKINDAVTNVESKSLNDQMEKLMEDSQNSPEIMFNYVSDKGRFCGFNLKLPGSIYICEGTDLGFDNAKIAKFPIENNRISDVNELKKAIKSETICDLLFNSPQKVFAKKGIIMSSAVEQLAASITKQDNASEVEPLFLEINKPKHKINVSTSEDYTTESLTETEDMSLKEVLSNSESETTSDIEAAEPFSYSHPGLKEEQDLTVLLNEPKQASENADFLGMAGMFLTSAGHHLAQSGNYVAYGCFIMTGACIGIAAAAFLSGFNPVAMGVAALSGAILGATTWELTKIAASKITHGMSLFFSNRCDDTEKQTKKTISADAATFKNKTDNNLSNVPGAKR